MSHSRSHCLRSAALIRTVTMLLLVTAQFVGLPVSAEDAASDASGMAGIDASAEATDRLRQFQAQTQSLQGQFQQLIIEGNGLSDEESRSGDFWVERPDKIRWHYRQPYEQLIVADGTNVWLFDPDLEQVLVRELKPDSDDVAGLLLGSGDDLAQRFAINALGENRYRLLPLATESVIEQVIIEFQQQLIVSLEVRDKLGVTSRFEFLNLQSNSDIDPERFHFIPPNGVDIVIQ